MDTGKDVVFSRFFVCNNPEAEAKRCYAHAALNYKTEREHTRHSFGFLPQGYSIRKPLNLEKTIYSVISVILINL